MRASPGAARRRRDPLRPDRWRTRFPPLARSEHPGASLYWEGLQKGKRSIAIDLGSREGRELAVALITAPGEGGGLFVTISLGADSWPTTSSPRSDPT
ncbi:MAG: CoA transferase [Burkholderiaceae bacterium]